MSKEQLQANLKKCIFSMRVSLHRPQGRDGEGFKIDLVKTRVILNWPTPKNLHELRSFMGLVNYLRKFVASYLELALPLNTFTKGNAIFI